MGGSWTPDPLPIRPGGYINFESSGSAPVQPGTFGRVGMPIRAEWGPANEFVDIVTDADRTSTYGNIDGDTASTTDTSWLIREAIIGGAELVKAYRMVGAGAAAGACTIQDWLLKNTLDITAKYAGLRSANFSITVGASLVFPTKSVLSVVETIGANPVVLESHVYDDDDVTGLLAAINSTSNYIVAAFSAGADPEASEVATISSTVTPPIAGEQYRLVVDYGDGSAPQTTADLLVQDNDAAITAALNALSGIAPGDVVVTTTAGGPGFDVASTTRTFTFAGALANQNVSLTVINGTVPMTNPLVAATGTQGGRSPLRYGTTAMAGAASGAAPTFATYFGDLVTTGVTTLFEAEGGFDLFAFDGVSEEDLVGFNAAVKSWADTNNEAGRYMFVVVGGGGTELANADVATAIARTALFDAAQPGLPSHPEFVANIGVSGLEIVTPAGNTLQLTAAQSAARFAGIIASAGITGSVTFKDTGAAAVNGSMTPAQIETLIQQGVIAFSKRGDFVRIEDGVTAFISLTEEKDFTFTQIRAARAIQQIGIDVSTIVENDWVGQKVNTVSVRDSLVSTLQGYFAQLEAQNVLVNGTQVQIDTRYDNTKTNVFVLVLAQFQFELKRVLLTVRVPTVS